METCIRHFEEVIAYHNPNWHSGKVFNYAHNISTYHNAILGLNQMIENNLKDKRFDLVKKRQQTRKIYRAKVEELKAQAGILVEYAGGYILSDAETKRMDDISEKEFRKANAHLYKKGEVA